MRVALAVVAVLVIAWLGVMERDLRLQESGTAALEAGELDRAGRDLRGARLLNPDPAPDVSLALVQQARGDQAGAQAAIEAVVREEPDNLLAWATLALLTRGVDDAAAERAAQARERLDPLNAR